MYTAEYHGNLFKNQSIIIFFTVFIFMSICNGQDPWMRTYGGTANDVAYVSHSTADGGFITTGTTESFGAGNQDFWLLSTDSVGDTLWSRTYGGSGSDDIWSSIITNNNQILLCGATTSYGAGSFDIWLVCTDSLGNTLWTNTYGGPENDFPCSVVQTSDNGFIIAGYTESFGAGDADIWVVKTDAAGDSLWSKTIGGAGFDVGRSVIQLSNNNLIVVGSSESFGAGDSDIAIVMLSSTGDSLSTDTYGGLTEDEAKSVIELEDGFLVAGKTYSSPGDDGAGQAFLLKANLVGDTLWTRSYGLPESSISCYSVARSQNGGYVLAGNNHHGPSSYNDVIIMKTNDLGDLIWTKTFGGVGSDYLWDIKTLSDGGYLATGSTVEYGAGGFDVWLVKIDSVGNNFYDQVETESITYPLAIGNEWHYRSIWEPDDYDFGIQDEIHRVVSDTLMPNGKTYWKIDVIDLTGTSGINSFFQRYSVEDGIVFLYGEGTCLDDEYELFNLNYVETGDYGWNTCDDTVEKFNTYFDWEGPGSYLRTDQDGLIHTIQEFVDGIGLRSTFTSEIVTYSKTLEGWIIDGVEGGTLLGTRNTEQSPTSYKLYDAYPNPFNPSTTIKYDLPEYAEVSLTVYDVAGREVNHLFSGEQPAGSYDLTWNGIDSFGQMVSTGVYFARLQAGEHSSVVKMLFLK